MRVLALYKGHCRAKFEFGKPPTIFLIRVSFFAGFDRVLVKALKPVCLQPLLSSNA